METLKKFSLNESHVKVYKYVKRYYKMHQFSPTIDEIVDGTEISKRHLFRIIKDLVSEGYMSRKPFYKRGLKVEKDL